MTSVADRIAWILQEKKWSARELARKAELSETTVSKALEALTKDPDGIVLRTLRAIAKGAGISLAWLATGEGSPYAAPAEASDLWPNRSAGAALARQENVPEEAIQSVLSQPVTAEQAAHSPAWWAEFMRLRDVELNEHRLAKPLPRTTPTTVSASKRRREHDGATAGGSGKAATKPRR